MPLETAFQICSTDPRNKGDVAFACQPSFEKWARASNREQFLETMGAVVLRIMLRIYFLQHWFNLSNPGAESRVYPPI